jgi:hypothetical protein
MVTAPRADRWHERPTAMLGGTALLSDYDRSRNLVAVLFTPVLIMLIPIFDISVVTVTRTLSGRPAS